MAKVSRGTSDIKKNQLRKLKANRCWPMANFNQFIEPSYFNLSVARRNAIADEHDGTRVFSQ